MAYNKKDYARIKREYSEKYVKARTEADIRRQELHAKIPEIRMIDGVLARTGMDIMGIIMSEGRETAEQRVAELRARNEELLSERKKILIMRGYPEDYSDVHYECEKCGDTGYVDTKMCSCMRRALIYAGYESSGLGKLIHTQSFDNFSFDSFDNKQEAELMKHNFSVLKRYAETFSGKNETSFLLVGRTGLGKTHLSTAVAKTVIDNGYDVSYVTAVKMFNDFEDRRFHRNDRDEAPDISRYYDAQLLIIDDFGTEAATQYSVACTYDVINTRINNGLGTVISTNLSKKELEQKYGERVASRLFGEYMALLFRGADMRYKKIGK